ncbi:MAG: UDP-N-acetylmuramoyl-tripeptide--D-alanyl-D-alanine ligase [Gammaproteobacteria bacterium]
MISLSLSEAARATGGVLSGPGDSLFNGVATDTRTLRGGELFVCLQGPNFDAHDFLAVARDAGVAGAVVKEGMGSKVDSDGARIEVGDTRVALADLARHWRRRFAGKVGALTGSNGKTSVKEMAASILRVSQRVHATQGNLNNDIGVPLTLLGLGNDHDCAVIEMGANHPREIETLTAIAEPDAGLVNNAGPAHLEGFGSLDGVARSKGELFEGLPDGALAIINADDPYARLWCGMASTRPLMRFGLERGVEIRGAWEPTTNGGRLRAETPAGAIDVDMAVSGRHNGMNALAATALALSLDASVQDVEQGLASFRPVGGRLRALAGPAKSTILDDTYNANPASLAAGVAVLVARPGAAWLVLGDMGELGAMGAELHERAGDDAREAGVRRLFALGPVAAGAARAFGPGGTSFDSFEALMQGLRRALEEEGDASVSVLVKGSRTMRMERVVNELATHGEVSTH